MSRAPVLPVTLTKRPFSLADARRAGIERWHLQGHSWSRIDRGIYAWSGLAATAMRKLEAVLLRLPPEAAFSGRTAAWLNGLDVEPCDPIEVTIPKEAGVSGRVGVVVRRAPLPAGDVTIRQNMRVTSPVRTVGEVCSALTLTEAVVIADMALHAELVSSAQLRSWVASHAGRRGIKTLRQVLDLAEPRAESPMESRLRMILLLGGLPKPQVQVPIHDASGGFLGRPDLYYEQGRLGIEYDGGGHRATLSEDNRRQNRLLDAGVRLLRFTASDLADPASVAALVRSQITPSVGNRGFRSSLINASAGTREKN